MAPLKIDEVYSSMNLWEKFALQFIVSACICSSMIFSIVVCGCCGKSKKSGENDEEKVATKSTRNLDPPPTMEENVGSKSQLSKSGGGAVGNELTKSSLEIKNAGSSLVKKIDTASSIKTSIRTDVKTNDQQLSTSQMKMQTSKLTTPNTSVRAGGGETPKKPLSPPPMIPNIANSPSAAITAKQQTTPIKSLAPAPNCLVRSQESIKDDFLFKVPAAEQKMMAMTMIGPGAGAAKGREGQLAYPMQKAPSLPYVDSDHEAYRTLGRELDNVFYTTQRASVVQQTKSPVGSLMPNSVARSITTPMSGDSSVTGSQMSKGGMAVVVAKDGKGKKKKEKTPKKGKKK